MLSATPVETLVSHASANALVLARRAETDDLGETIAALAARLHAATYELLVLLREFDARSGWNNGCLSCAHWLHSTPTRTPRASGAPASTPTRTPRASGAPAWRTGIDLGAAREKVRVAKALPALPRISETMQRGQISYAKVRALTRVATPENERALLDLALAGTAAHVERFVRAWRRVDRVVAAKHTETQHLNRQLSTWVDDDGMVVIRGRLTPEVGAVVQRALEAAADRLFRDAAHASTGNAMAEDLTPAQRRADALALLAESALAANVDGGTAGDRYQVVLHVNADQPGTARPGRRRPRRRLHSMALSKWTMARCTFPRKRLSGCRATPRSWRCATTPTARSSTWAARRARFRHRSVALSPRAIPVAAFRVARPAGATRITCITPPQRADHARRGPRLGRWRRHGPRQPRASVPAPPPRRPRRWIRRDSWARRCADLPPA